MNAIIEKMTPEQRKKFEAGEMNAKDLEALGLLAEDSYGDESGFEEGEDESEEPKQAGNKRQKGE